MHVRSIAAAAGMLAALIPATAAHAADPAQPAAEPRTPAAATFTVPLPTGDTVTVERSGARIGSATVTPGPGRENVTFTTSSVGSGDVSVVPSDAEPLLASGRLDPRLFEVKALLDAGYGTKGVGVPGPVRMIVQHAKGAGAASRARDAAGGAARPGRAIPRLGLTAFAPHDGTDAAGTWKRLTAGTGRSLTGGADKLWLDGRMHVALDKSVPQINAPRPGRTATPARGSRSPSSTAATTPTTRIWRAG